MKIRTDHVLFKDREQTTNKIKKFWNKLSLPWHSIWGNHIHHGYYQDADITPQRAQEILLEKLLEHCPIKSQADLLDVGCGLGGTSIYLATRFKIHVTGISISDKQIEIAQSSAAQKNVQNVTFHVEDALAMQSFHKHQFDVIWSLESCEQFFNKKIFLSHVNRLLKPGGKFLLATWCASADEYQDIAAKRYYKLCKAFDLPYMPTIDYYQRLLQEENFQILQSLDWTQQVAKSWQDGIAHVKRYNWLQMLKLGGIRGWRFVQQLKLMRQAFRYNEIKYGVFIAQKPEVDDADHVARCCSSSAPN